jgi:hypothetical protein
LRDVCDRNLIYKMRANDRIIVIVLIYYSMRVHAVVDGFSSDVQGESGPSLAPEV